MSEVSNPACTDGGPTWCCVDSDGTGLWCESCLAFVARLSDERLLAELRRIGIAANTQEGQ